MENLDEILKGEPTPEPVAEAPTSIDEPSGIADPPSDRLRDDKGRFAPKETGVQPEPALAATATSEAPPAPADQLPQAEYAALRDERRKRQETERRLETMERELRQRQTAPQQPPVDFWDDPQSFMDTRLNQLGETLLQQFEQRQTTRRIEASERAAQAKYTDYSEAFTAFEQAVQTNPRLAYEMAQSENPGEFAYSKGKTALTLSSVGSLDELKAQLRQEWEAEVRAVVPTPAPFPSTTAADGSVGGRTGPDWTGPKPLNQILG